MKKKLEKIFFMMILHVQCLVKIGADETLLEAVVGVCHVTHNGCDSHVCGRYSFHESATTDVVYVTIITFFYVLMCSDCPWWISVVLSLCFRSKF
jgi:5-deoxy-D-glucuronate isomerase